MKTITRPRFHYHVRQGSDVGPILTHKGTREGALAAAKKLADKLPANGKPVWLVVSNPVTGKTMEVKL